MCTAASCIHTHPEREPLVYQGVQSCSDTHNTSLTHYSGLCRASLSPVGGLELGVGVGITLCLGLTPQSSNWEKRSCLWRPPPSAAVMPFPLMSLSSPYALPFFCSLAMQVPSWPVPHPQRPSQLGNQKNVESAKVRVPPILKDCHFSLRVW